jgi:hypothetical protein
VQEDEAGTECAESSSPATGSGKRLLDEPCDSGLVDPKRRDPEPWDRKISLDPQKASGSPSLGARGPGPN